MEEKRTRPRIATSMTVQDLAALRVGRITNLSRGGCFIERSDAFDFLPMASRLTLKLEVPGTDEMIVAFGIVRHRGKKREGFGIQFEALDKQSTYYLEKFMGTFL